MALIGIAQDGINAGVDTLASLGGGRFEFALAGLSLGIESLGALLDRLSGQSEGVWSHARLFGIQRSAVSLDAGLLGLKLGGNLGAKLLHPCSRCLTYR